MVYGIARVGSRVVSKGWTVGKGAGRAILRSAPAKGVGIAGGTAAVGLGAAFALNQVGPAAGNAAAAITDPFLPGNQSDQVGPKDNDPVARWGGVALVGTAVVVGAIMLLR